MKIEFKKVYVGKLRATACNYEESADGSKRPLIRKLFSEIYQVSDILVKFGKVRNTARSTKMTDVIYHDAKLIEHFRQASTGTRKLALASYSRSL